MILSLQTTTFGAFGGIPTYNRLVCRVLNGLGTAQQNHVLIGTDKMGDIETPRLELANLQIEAFAQNRLALLRRLISLALTCRFDLALIGHVNYAPLGWLLKRLKPQLRYGVILYGVEAWQQLPRYKRHALQHADFLISISGYTKRMAIEANALDADLIYLLPNALEWAAEASRKGGKAPQFLRESGRAVSGDGTNLLSVCRLDKYEQYKGVDKVIEALPQVAQRIPNIRYTVIASGTDLDRHRKLAEELRVADRVIFLGSVDDTTLRASYRDCDLFVLPSAGEGFGFVFLEAMKFGKAILAASSGGAPEVVEDEVTGRLVEYGNKVQLVEALIELCLDRDERERLGHAGYQRLQERFTFAQFEQRLTDILRRELPSAENTCLAPVEADTRS